MRLKFKGWVELSNLQESLPNSDTIIQIIKLAEMPFDDKEPWWETAEKLEAVLSENSPKSIPLFRRGTSDKQEKAPWDYADRDWPMWSHMLAKSYGWDLEYIANLDFDDALAMILEILVDEQLEQERQWSMSEIAYPYNKGSKKSEFKALPRPAFMKAEPKEMKPIKILRRMLPVGLVLGVNDEPPNDTASI